MSEVLIKKGSRIRCHKCKEYVLEAAKDIHSGHQTDASDVIVLKGEPIGNSTFVKCPSCGWHPTCAGLNYFLCMLNWEFTEG